MFIRILHKSRFIFLKMVSYFFQLPNLYPCLGYFLCFFLGGGRLEHNESASGDSSNTLR